MYQAFVLGLGVLLLLGVGYFVKHTDQAGVIDSSLSQSTNSVRALSQKEELPGVYVCDAGSGCESSRTLTVYPTGELKMTTSYEGGVETIDEVGTWSFSEKEGLLCVFTGTTNDTYIAPHTLKSHHVSTSTLSDIIYDSSVYTDFKNPVFLKQQIQTGE